MCIRDSAGAVAGSGTALDGNTSYTIETRDGRSRCRNGCRQDGIKRNHIAAGSLNAVSYTHLDVYKRQV